jgi:sugar fermentation stimulation protein A
MSDWMYLYPPLLAGTLLKRYKRFFADIELDTGEVITAHCPNTGPMTGVCSLGSPVQVSVSDNPKRKLKYTWEMISVNDNGPTWVGVNTSLPNQVIKQLLIQHRLPPITNYETVASEIPYGRERSRIDFLLTGAAHLAIYLEVKNTTWAQGELALFPDTVTTRGQKHIRELQALLPEARACLLYFINRGDCTHFTSGDRADPVYGQLLRDAIQAGLEVLPCRFEVSPQGIRYLGLANLVL